MKLEDQLKITLANTFAFYLKAHNYHWNVEGPNFSEYHSFFNIIYTETWEAIDNIAEHIRTLDSYVPGSFSRFKELSSIEDETKIPQPINMIKNLESDNKIVIASLLASYKLAESENKLGLANFLQDRIDIHEKYGWQLRSFLKKV